MAKKTKKKKDRTEFFLAGSSITETLNTDGFETVLSEVQKGADFQIASFNAHTDKVIDFLNELLGQDDVMQINKKQYLVLLKVQTDADNLLSYKKEV